MNGRGIQKIEEQNGRGPKNQNQAMNEKGSKNFWRYAPVTYGRGRTSVEM